MCDVTNMNLLCGFDDLDCCLNASLVNNGECNQDNLNVACDFDGNDCRGCVMWRQTAGCDPYSQREPFNDKSCSTEIPPGGGYCECEHGNTLLDKCRKKVTKGYSTCEEACKHGCYFENCPMIDLKANVISPCPNEIEISNGFCNIENRNAICNYDGGDCCPNSDLISNGQCDIINYNYVCLYDGGDCCYTNDGLEHLKHHDHLIGDGQCSYLHNLEMCNFDQGDCCDNYRIADGICDDTNNNRLCYFDGGDCCFGHKNTSRCFLCKCFGVFDVNYLSICSITLHVRLP